MKYLIFTEPDDMHAILVKMALENTGHEVQCLFSADLPTKQKNSVFIDSTSYHWKALNKEEAIKGEDYDVVWWRRARKPYVPKAITHPKDYQFVLKENALFYESITYNLAHQAWWVNPKEAAKRANSKLLQLRLAREMGLNIPQTLCSNDPKEIRCFLLKYEREGVVYKPLCSNFWFEEGQIKIAYTSKISFLDLPNNKLLQLVPGIFQKEVKKKFELRITCFGDYLVAAKLNSQDHEEGKIDWRAIPAGKLTIEPYELPVAVAQQIRQFMRKMGLHFGSFDFIVTPDNLHIFLEVNEQGQFLWIEEYNPDFKMLDIFTQFLIHKSLQFRWRPKAFKHSINNYRPEMENQLLQNAARHVNLNCPTMYKE